MNPGGPGGSGVAFLRNVASFLPAELRDRFDLVGFDPRGVGESTPVRCFASAAEQQAFFSTLPLPFPTGPAEEATFVQGASDFAERCAERNPDLLAHMATADAARDMDLIRAALGEPSLTYLGFSYGTFLGATYANLFPDHARALALDGSVDPVQWTTGRGDQADHLPLFARMKSHIGASETLGEFLRLCAEAGPARCGFAVGTDHRATSERFAKLMDRLRAHPVLIPTPGGPVQGTYAYAVSVVLRALYVPPVWPFLAEGLQQLELGDGQLMYQISLALDPPPATTYDNRREVQAAVLCADSDNPETGLAWPPAARAADMEAPYFGSIWSYATLACADWPSSSHQDRYAGPFDRVTTNPVLVVGNRFDPVTPYAGAKALADELGNARLLTLEGWGHGAFFESTCAMEAEVRYLVNLTLPAEGTVCTPDVRPFDV
jgi:pimeloyl-ACP methyl ester carboxylesterase